MTATRQQGSSLPSAFVLGLIFFGCVLAAAFILVRMNASPAVNVFPVFKKQDRSPPVVHVRLEANGVETPLGQYPVISPGETVTVRVTTIDDDPSPSVTLEGRSIDGEQSWIDDMNLLAGTPIVFPSAGDYVIWVHTRDAEGNQSTAVANVMVRQESSATRD